MTLEAQLRSHLLALPGVRALVVSDQYIVSGSPTPPESYRPETHGPCIVITQQVQTLYPEEAGSVFQVPVQLRVYNATIQSALQAAETLFDLIEQSTTESVQLFSMRTTGQALQSPEGWPVVLALGTAALIRI